MSEQAQAFDRAFSPTKFSNVIRANLNALSADLLIGGKVYAVSPARCEVCEEWEPDCEHLELVKEFVVREIRVDDERYGDHCQERADLYVGMGA